MLADNRPATYIQQLDKIIEAQPAIVMCVIPNNKVPIIIQVLLCKHIKVILNLNLLCIT